MYRKDAEQEIFCLLPRCLNWRQSLLPVGSVFETILERVCCRLASRSYFLVVRVSTQVMVSPWTLEAQLKKTVKSL